MYARATTTITIYRGEDTDEWGDPEDVNTPVATGIRASIIEAKIYNKSEVTTQPRNFHYAKLRLTRTVDVRINDRVLDEKTDRIWTITNISVIQNPVIGQDLRIDLLYVE